MAHYEAEVVALGRLFNEARRDNWGFVPVSDAELRLMARDLRPIVDHRIALIAEVDGETVGCAFALPDVGSILKKINGRLFPFGWARLLRLENEVVGLCAEHLGGDEHTVGSFTSGGTESILLAV